MPLYWTIDSRARLFTGIADREVSFSDVMGLLEAMTRAAALPYRKLFDGSAAVLAMTAEELLMVCARIRSYHAEATVGPLALMSTSGRQRRRADCRP